MTDLVSVANLALSLIKTAGEQLNKLRERAQTTKDLEIKEHVGNLYDTFNALREALSRMVDENKELKRQLEQEQLARVAIPKIRQVGDTNYYYQGEEGPFCQPCYLGTGKLVAVLPPESWNGGVRTECPVCHEFFYEKRMDFSPKSLKPYIR
jgi:hypothetical protein